MLGASPPSGPCGWARRSAAGAHVILEVIWARIEAWLRRHAPDELEHLRPPATNRRINRLEDATGLRLPPDMEQSYRVHDGCWVGLFLFDGAYGGVLSSLQAVEDDWRRWRAVAWECGFADLPAQPAGPIRPQHWDPGWLPVTDAGSGNFFCVDLHPAPAGAVGQVIWYDRVDGPVRVVGAGFAAWLEQTASGLEAGRYAYHLAEGFIDTQFGHGGGTG